MSVKSFFTLFSQWVVAQQTSTVTASIKNSLLCAEHVIKHITSGLIVLRVEDLPPKRGVNEVVDDILV